ncbi:MAG: hypothetical protein KKD35_04915 [Elusimicrobia bacterium]|nr:hypothetical protein [Elusimicrobiota bacterium]
MSNYDPQKAVKEFISYYGDRGLQVLKAYQAADPFKGELSDYDCGDEDACLHHATKFIRSFWQYACCVSEDYEDSCKLTQELVRRSFSPREVAHDVSEQAIRDIAHILINEVGLRLPEKKAEETPIPAFRGGVVREGGLCLVCGMQKQPGEDHGHGVDVNPQRGREVEL